MNSAAVAPLLPAIAAACEASYPAEACGLLIESAHGAVEFVAIPNIAGSAAAVGLSSRSRRDGYVMEPARLLAALEAADAAGARLAAIVHSHPDAEAALSAEDRAAALGGGAPLWPGVDYLVVSCRSGRSVAARVFRWDAASADFYEEELPWGQTR